MTVRNGEKSKKGMNAVEKADATDNSVKMSKRKSKNRKHQQSQQHPRPQEPAAGAGNKAQPEDIVVNGESLALISEKLSDSLHIKENGCMENHITKDDIDHDRKTGQEVLHGAKYQTNSKGAPQETQKSKILENGEAKTAGGKPPKKSSENRTSPTKVNGNNNSRSHDGPWTAAVDTSSGTEGTSAPAAELQKSFISHQEASDSSDCCQREASHAPTQNGVLSPSSSERLSNSSVDQVTSLPKEVGDSNPAQSTSTAVSGLDPSNIVIEYKEYESELQMQDIMRLIQTELSEPYSIYTYRYFIYNWPKLCFLAAHGKEYVGAIVCKLDMHMNVKRGYIAMLAVKKEYRKLKIGTTLVQKAIEAMLADDADEVVLETEMKNIPALRLYENLGFVRDKRLFRYYLNGVDALRLKLWFR